MRKRTPFFIGFLLSATLRGELLLKDYLDQVKAQNEGVRGSILVQEGSLLRSGEADLATTFSLFSTLQYTSDGKPTSSESLTGKRTLRNEYTLGVSKQTHFGLQTKFYYNILYTEIVGASSSLVPRPRFYEAKPVLELTQSLWRNSFGSEVRALERLLSASAMAIHFSESFKTKTAFAEAEGAYWRLVLAHQEVNVQKQSLERGQKIRDLSERRVSQGLSDKTDLLQAEAALKVRQLEFDSAMGAEGSAARVFNSFRGVSSESVTEKLEELDSRKLLTLVAPDKHGAREDVIAAQKVKEAAEANAQLGTEKSRPVLELYSILSLAGREGEMSNAVAESIKTSHPTATVGLRVVAPLDFGLLTEMRAGYEKERMGAEHIYRRKQFENDVEWVDVSLKFIDSQKRLRLAIDIEEAQKDKVKHERDRHSRGRTTIFQVLQFEQDYAASQLNRIRLQAEVLKFISQIRTWSGL